MLAPDQREVIHQLIVVLHAGLGSVIEGAELEIQILLDGDVREHIQPRVLEVARRYRVGVAAVAKPQLVQCVGGESVELGQVERALADVPVVGEDREIRGCIDVDSVRLRLDVAEAELVRLAKIVVRVSDPIIGVQEVREADWQNADRHALAQHSGGGTGGRSRLEVLFEDAQVRARESGDAVQQAVALRRRRVGCAQRRTGLAQRIVLEQPEVEELVLHDRPTDAPSERVLVETGNAADSLAGIGLVHRVQIAVLEVLVQVAVDLVGAALECDVELAAGGMTKLRVELVLKHREFFNGLIGDPDVRTGDVLPGVVHTLDHEVVLPGPLSSH